MTDFDQHNDDSLAFDDEYKSKTQVKKDMLALLDFGAEIADLSVGDLKKIPMDEQLAAEFQTVRKIRKGGARKRQLQYIGKLLRNRDLEAMEEAMRSIKGISQQEQLQLHRLEQWRERLLNDGDSALSALIEEYPSADRQQIRQLVRQANKESEKQQASSSARKLFRYLRELSS